MMQYPSKWMEAAVEEISKLPGIGRKSALRIVLHLLKKDKNQSLALAQSIKDLRENIKYCSDCGNISDDTTCQICRSPRRDHSIICVVEDTRDVMAIENTGQFNGLYHVLGGVISPIDGIGPEELNIQKLLDRIREKSEDTKELIFAFSPTMEGDTTAFYIAKKTKEFGLRISSIARGVPIGGELEYADEITLGRSIMSRVRYDSDI